MAEFQGRSIVGQQESLHIFPEVMYRTPEEVGEKAIVMASSRIDVIVIGGVEVHFVDDAPFVRTKIVGSVMLVS